MRSRLVAIAVAAVCLVAAAYLILAQRQASDLQHARDLARAGHYGAAVRLAEGISGASATAARAVVAEALARNGGGAAADRAFGRAVAADPTNWALRRDWAVLLYVDGQRRRASRQAEAALSLNPRIELPTEFFVR
jgi:Flp pilus assembly protein TadD